MGSGPSKTISSDPDVPYLVFQAGLSASSKLSSSKDQPLLTIVIDENVWKTKGEIVSGTLAEIECGGWLGVFDLNHAFVVFEFSNKFLIRCEVSCYKSGTAIFISKVGEYTCVNWQEFPCSTPGLSIKNIIDWAKQFYDNGEYHVEKRNCYDFVAFMLSRDFYGADIVTKKWKRLEIQKVPSLLRD